MNATELEAYCEGLSAGGRYFNFAIDSGRWEAPPNPYAKDSKEAESYDSGFWTAVDDLERAYYA